MSFRFVLKLVILYDLERRNSPFLRYFTEFQLPQDKRGQPPSFSPCLLWLNGRPFQLLLSSC